MSGGKLLPRCPGCRPVPARQTFRGLPAVDFPTFGSRIRGQSRKGSVPSGARLATGVGLEVVANLSSLQVASSGVFPGGAEGL